MNQKKIPTSIGVAVIIIIAITIGMFTWKWEKVEDQIAPKTQDAITTENQGQLSVSKEVEFPTVKAQSGMSLEDIIKQALYEKTPDWKIRNYDIDVTIETNKNSHAIGRFVYDGYNITKDGKYHNASEGIWFAAKSDEGWTLIETAGASYWGSCQNFKKYEFPSDMIPDCWDADKKVLIDTSNPKNFYPNGFTKADKKKLVKAFLSYIRKQKNSGKWEPDIYLQKDLYVKVDEKVDNYIAGAILVGGIQNISAPYFLAVKKNGNWIVVYNGQDNPYCSDIEMYHFPHEIIDQCYDEQSKSMKDVS